MKRDLSKILWGVVLVLLGVIWGINSLGIMKINIFFAGWWTLFIIIPSAIGLFENRKENKLGNLIGLILGVMLFLGAQGICSFDLIWKLFFPVVVVLIGLSMIFGNKIKDKIDDKLKEIKSDDLEAIVATFGENKIDKSGEKFEGAKIDSVFGSVILDLTDAKLKNETVIEASAIFGSIDILVPKDVLVKVKSTSIFGGTSNNNRNIESKKVIYIDALCLFGGIDIK